MRGRFSNFMMGRYGMDNLNRFLLYLGGILILIGLFVHVHLLNLVTVAILIILYCRMFSRSIYKRQQENLKYLEIKSKIFGGRSRKSSGRKFSKARNDGKRVLICPYCKEKLRVPVGAGKIKVKCPHCRQQFEETV